MSIWLSDIDTIEASVGIFERFCCPTYQRVCAAFGEVAAFDGAKRIADRIVRRKMDKIRVGDVTKLAWQGLRDVSRSRPHWRRLKISIGCASRPA